MVTLLLYTRAFTQDAFLEHTKLTIKILFAWFYQKKHTILVFIGIKFVLLLCKYTINAMEISGKIIAALEPRGGVSQRTGSNWKVQEFVIETHEQYPRKCCFEVFGEERLQTMNIQVGEELTVSFDIDAREWTGQDGRSRWTNQLRAWRVVRYDPNAPQQAATAPAPPYSAAPAGAPTPPPATSAPADGGNPFAAGQGENFGDMPF